MAQSGWVMISFGKRQLWKKETKGAGCGKAWLPRCDFPAGFDGERRRSERVSVMCRRGAPMILCCSFPTHLLPPIPLALIFSQQETECKHMRPPHA